MWKKFIREDTIVEKERRGFRNVPPALLRRLLLSWLIAAAAEYMLLAPGLWELSGPEGLVYMSLPRVLLGMVIGTAVLSVIGWRLRTEKFERWAMPVMFAVYAGAVLRSSLAAVHSSFSWGMCGGCVVIESILLVYAIFGWDGRAESIYAEETDNIHPVGKEMVRKTYISGLKMKSIVCAIPLTLTILLSVAFFLFVTAWTVGRVYSFSTPTYDFGIFSQMFYYMKKCGLPFTTLERDGLLSHFAVHVSPIFYLLLPVYALFPYPATLQVCQAAVLTSAVIPLWKLGKRHGLPELQRLFVCALLLLYPAFSGGTSYDIHENCFLTPLILWLFYGIDAEKPAVIAVSALLTLMVKEDAAVYVAVIGLWLMVRSLLQRENTAERTPFGKRKSGLPTGILLLTVSLLWFFLTTSYLANYGDGVMTYRYDNLIYDGSKSLITVIKAILLCPMKALYECVDSEKLSFIALTMLPLLGLPLLTRRYERYLLLIPYILVNLLSDYKYQHDIFFQYTFGSTAFLLYLAVVNAADWKRNWLRNLALAAAAAVSVWYFADNVVPKGVSYPRKAMERYEEYEDIRQMLDAIPEDASVAASTVYTTRLSGREILYDVKHASKEHLLSCDYVALDPAYEEICVLLEDNEYNLVERYPGKLVIYRAGTRE